MRFYPASLSICDCIYVIDINCLLKKHKAVYVRNIRLSDGDR